MKTLYTYEFEEDYEYEVKPFAKYRDFADVPDKTPETALHWLMAIHATKAKPLQEQFEQIPVPLWTGKLLFFAVTYQPTVLSIIPPQHAPNYQSLCVLASRKDFLTAGMFHEDFRTPETIERMLDERINFHQSFQQFPWISAAMTPELMEKAASRWLALLLLLPAEKVSYATLRARFDSSLSAYRQARKAGRLDLPARMIRTGGWPNIYDPDALKSVKDFRTVMLVEKPNSLRCGMDLMLEGEDVCPVYMAFVMSHPLDDVIAHVNSRKYVPYIIEMYKEEELRPYINTNRLLKAGLLESALGL